MSPPRGKRRRRRKNPKARATPPRAAERRARERRGPGAVVSLEPLSPIVVRSGRPLEGRSDADPARFPPPSTVAGCLRTAWARAADRPFGPDLARIPVAGPLLLDGNDRVLAPKPADALYFGHGDSAKCARAAPRPFDADCGADLPDGLMPVRLTESIEEKRGDGPAWWSWDDLMAFRRCENVARARLCENGWSPPPGDRRTHISIDSKTGAAADGGIFQTEGLDLGASHDPGGSSAGGLRLLARCGENLGSALAHLGGKRRLAALEPEREETWPAPPLHWLDMIAGAGGLCLTLLTPAVFSAGYRPGWLDGDMVGSPPGLPDVRLKLCAAAVDRWQPHSGWDLARRRARPSRKLVGAGATYWFRILDAVAPETLKPLWLTCVSDDGQDRRDGFGLVLPSRWKPLDERTP